MATDQIIQLYIDDSGTRHPDHRPGRTPRHGYDYFALGGILIKESEEHIARRLYDEFCAKWNITYPLHSSEIRGRNKGFKWIGTLPEKEQNKFYEELYQMLASAPVLGIACAIDRQGYNDRYREKYGRKRWALCKTSFSIILERASKYATRQGCRLRVLPERCSKKEDKVLRDYYEAIKNEGMPFSSENSSSYEPLKASDFQRILYEFRLKAKSSPMVQLADLYLWPMAMGGYDENNRPYKRLLGDGKLVDCIYNKTEVPYLGIKYSCFDFKKNS